MNCPLSLSWHTPAFVQSWLFYGRHLREWLLSSGMMDNVTSVSGGGGSSKDGMGSNNSNKHAVVLKKHMLLVIGNELLKKSKPNAFFLPRHSRCEAFSTFSAAGLLVSPCTLLCVTNICVNKNSVLISCHSKQITHFFHNSHCCIATLIRIWMEHCIIVPCWSARYQSSLCRHKSLSQLANHTVFGEPLEQCMFAFK